MVKIAGKAWYTHHTLRLKLPKEILQLVFFFQRAIPISCNNPTAVQVLHYNHPLWCDYFSYCQEVVHAEVLFSPRLAKIITSSLPEPYRQDLAFRLFNAVSRRPKDMTRANIPFANLHDGRNSVNWRFSPFGTRNSSISPYIQLVIQIS